MSSTGERDAPVETDGNDYLRSLCAITLPMGPPPEELSEQRTWAELRKLQLETERTAIELEIMRRREVEAAADPSRAHVYTFYSGVDAESVRECMAELGLWSRRD